MNKSQKITGFLMIISGITHVTQLLVYPKDFHVIGASIFGLIYFMIGIALFRWEKIGFWLGSILPTIGGILGFFRFILIHPNPFTVFHLLVDVIVVPICIYNLRQGKKNKM